MPVRIGPTEPPRVPENSTVPKIAPWARMPKYSATVGETTTKSAPWENP